MPLNESTIIDPGKRGMVLYDYLLVQGGAERVSLLLADALTADLGVGFRLLDQFPEPLLNNTRLYDLKAYSASVPWRYVKVTRAFASRTAFLKDYRWVLYSGSCAPVAVRHHPCSLNVYYCHALPSFAYELQDYYLQQLPKPLRPALRALAAWLRPRYEGALRRMDVIIANSAVTQCLLKEYLGLRSVVVHPPVDIDQIRWHSQQNYYLSTARLESHKRVAVIVDAFRQMPEKRLVVAGWGSAGAALRHRAQGADNIRFVGWVSPERMRELLANCIASIYLGKNEPFGISPVESMAAGKPVIGVAEGGLLETVLADRTGLLLTPEPTPDAVIASVTQLTPERALAMRAGCEAQASQFTYQRFLNQMRSLGIDDGLASSA